MSYDYDALVTKLAQHRSRLATADNTQLEDLQESLQLFDELSGHCPMTPLLWMQYAHDMSELVLVINHNAPAARQARLQTLELGLQEFPGSAILHLHYCEWMVQHCQAQQDDTVVKQTQTALTTALQQVGDGSHRTEGELIAQLYRVWAYFVVTSDMDNAQELVLQSFLQRAQTPMQDANDSLKEEVHEFCQKHNFNLPDGFLQHLEDARRWEAKRFARLIPLEDDIAAAMHQEQIQYNMDDFLEENNNNFMWFTTTDQFTRKVLQQSELRCWNGLGGAATATACLKYATAARKLPIMEDSTSEQDKKELQRHQHQLVLNIYERAIAECPTVESVWLAYWKHLVYLWHHSSSIAPQQLKTVTVRAVRNCPFSVTLVQHQLQTALLLANANTTTGNNDQYVMDPEELLEVVHKALDSKFLPAPSHALDVYLTAIRVVLRRILTILATSVVGYTLEESSSNAKKPKAPQAQPLSYDKAELLPSKVNHNNTNTKKKNDTTATTTLSTTKLDDDAWQEVQDLCEEIRDMLEAANKRLYQDHKSWTEGRALLRHEWATLEQFVLAPLLSYTNDNGTDGNNGTSNKNKNSNPLILAHYDKVIKLHSPSHPDAYRALIQHVLHHGSVDSSSSSPGEMVVSRLRQVRGLYHKAIQSVGKSKPPKENEPSVATASTTVVPRDYETALTNLCQEYQDFERTFGSDQSLANATRMMQKKLQKTAALQKRQQDKQQKQQQQGQQQDVDEDADMEGAADETEPSAARANGTKRKASNAEEPQPTRKKRKTDADDKNATTATEAAGEPSSTAPQPKPQPKQQPKKIPKVKIGHIFHKAHPYTVRVSNLTVDTHEMDLVESFRQEHKCGPVVHARIMREKLPPHAKAGGGHTKGEVGISKGWGLVQFEERESVDKALELSDTVQIHGQTIHVERSHVPAVGIVPPGMHRPTADKQQKKQKKDKGDDKGETKDISKEESTEQAKDKGGNSSSSFGVLAFRPRGVTQKKKDAGPRNAHPKVRLSVPSAKNNDSEET